jgi:hypothetical protein
MCVVKLLLSPKGIVIAGVTAVRAVARGRPRDARSGRDFEITQTLFNRALASEIAVIIHREGDVHLAAESSEIVRDEAAHFTIHAGSAVNVNRCCDWDMWAAHQMSCAHGCCSFQRCDLANHIGHK